MRTVHIALLSLGCSLLGQAAHAAPTKRFKLERNDKGTLVGITMPGQFTVRAGGQIVMHSMGTRGTLNRLGATRIDSATPLGGGNFAVEATVAPRTPLGRLVRVMSEKSPAPVASNETGVAREQFSIGHPGGGGQVGVSMKVLTGAAALEHEYAQKEFPRTNAISFHAWANTPRR